MNLSILDFITLGLVGGFFSAIIAQIIRDVISKLDS